MIEDNLKGFVIALGIFCYLALSLSLFQLGLVMSGYRPDKHTVSMDGCKTCSSSREEIHWKDKVKVVRGFYANRYGIIEKLCWNDEYIVTLYPEKEIISAKKSELVKCNWEMKGGE